MNVYVHVYIYIYVYREMYVQGLKPIIGFEPGSTAGWASGQDRGEIIPGILETCVQHCGAISFL